MTLREWETLKTWKSIFPQTPQLWVVLRTFYSISYLNPPLLISENILNGKIRDNPTYGCNDEKAEHRVDSLLYKGRETSAKCFINIIHDKCHTYFHFTWQRAWQYELWMWPGQAAELVLHNDRSRYYEDCDGYKNWLKSRCQPVEGSVSKPEF